MTSSEPNIPGFPWPNGKKAAVAWSFDIDAESPILFENPSWAARLSTMSHQMFGPLVGVPRFLDLLERHGQKSTFFVPGFTAERYPDVIRSVVDAGHEIGHHGYLHEPLRDMTAAAEGKLIDKGLDALEKVAGVRPLGFRAPWGEMSYLTPALLADRGFIYDSTLMDFDSPYLFDVGDNSGRTLVELPIHWATDDWEQYAWIPGYDDSRPIESPAKVHEMWWLEIEAQIRYGGLVNLINHPFVSGRASRIFAMEQMLERLLADDRIWFTTLGEMASYVNSLGLETRYHDRY
jgi:peptidoglycan/xylan/chitin deacetylase (PgdA/CDA1 family)